MYKDGQLTISKWYQGMTKHPIMGFGLIQNAEVFENKGLVTSKKGLVVSSKTVNAVPIAYVTDIYGNTYHATSITTSGTLYKNTSTILASSLGSIYDIKIYKDYLWVRYASSTTSYLGAYGPLSSGSAQWFPTISSSFTSGYWGQLVVGQDDYLYSTNGNYIARIHVDSSGTVGVAPTITGSNTSLTALDLPDGQYATCLTEYGTKLAIGTATTNGGGRVYTWNRQAGTLGNPGLADLPVVFNESGVSQLFSYANKLYVTAGRNGNVYISDGTNFRKLAQIPFNNSQPFVSYYPNAIAISSKGNLLVGNVSTNGVTESGVWEITDNGEVVQAYTLSTGKTSSSNIGVGFISLNTSDNAVNVGWFKGATQGIDVDTDTYATFYVESPLVRVGAFNSKKTFQYIQFTLANLLTTSQTISISYRKNTTDTYTTIGTWSFTTLGAVQSFEDVAGINDCEFLQIKIEAYGVNLIDVILR